MDAAHPIPPECLEWRSYRALDLKRRGWIQRDIAEALDASEVNVSRWLARARDGGPGAIAPALPGPARVDTGIALAWAGGVRLPRPGLDLRPHRQGDRAGVRRP